MYVCMYVIYNNMAKLRSTLNTGNVCVIRLKSASLQNVYLSFTRLSLGYVQLPFVAVVKIIFFSLCVFLKMTIRPHTT